LGVFNPFSPEVREESWGDRGMNMDQKSTFVIGVFVEIPRLLVHSVRRHDPKASIQYEDTLGVGGGLEGLNEFGREVGDFDPVQPEASGIRLVLCVRRVEGELGHDGEGFPLHVEKNGSGGGSDDDVVLSIDSDPHRGHHRLNGVGVLSI